MSFVDVVCINVIISYYPLVTNMSSFICSQVSTTENLAIFIWDKLQKIMDKPQLLHEVKILETEKNHVVYRGGNTYQRKKNSTLHSNHHDVSSDSD